MNRWVMSYLALALRREGFAVQTLSYRTMRGTLAEHLARVAERIAALGAPRLHLVGHSLGGVIVLRYLQRGADPRVRRDRKSTRLNSSHGYISYAVFCLKKKKKTPKPSRSHSNHRHKVTK